MASFFAPNIFIAKRVWNGVNESGICRTRFFFLRMSCNGDFAHPLSNWLGGSLVWQLNLILFWLKRLQTNKQKPCKACSITDQCIWTLFHSIDSYFFFLRSPSSIWEWTAPKMWEYLRLLWHDNHVYLQIAIAKININHINKSADMIPVHC